MTFFVSFYELFEWFILHWIALSLRPLRSSYGLYSDSVDSSPALKSSKSSISPQSFIETSVVYRAEGSLDVYNIRE